LILGFLSERISKLITSCMQNVLLLSSGSKVTLARIVARSCKKRGSTLHGIDKEENVPTSHFVDSFQAINPKDWQTSVFQYCLNHRIGLIIPTRHADLLGLSLDIEKFLSHGIQIGISSPQTIEICIDKFSTYNFLTRNAFPIPHTYPLNPDTIESLNNCSPLIVKPTRGSGSRGVRIINHASEILPSELSGNHIAQEIAKGDEYTINVYVSRKGESICAIPHKRIVVENGESVQAITKRIHILEELARSISQTLPGAWGPLNIQAFYDAETGTAQIIEINPRVGGGFPLTHQAKGEFMEWLMEEAFEDKQLRPLFNWTSGLRMMRYRSEIFDHPQS